MVRTVCRNEAGMAGSSSCDTMFRMITVTFTVPGISAGLGGIMVVVVVLIFLEDNPRRGSSNVKWSTQTYS